MAVALLSWSAFAAEVDEDSGSDTTTIAAFDITIENAAGVIAAIIPVVVAAVGVVTSKKVK